MPTDPYIPARLEDEPRQETNLAPGVKLPAANAWRADRPGDLEAGQPSGALLGSPGPNVGYALTLVERIKDQLVTAPHEHLDDAMGVIAEIAMKRAALFGRAPVMADIDAARALLGYDGNVPADFVEWRVGAVHDADHDYIRRRSLVDAVPDDLLRLPFPAFAARVPGAQEALSVATVTGPT
ncbi:MAG TPA: hypothetical protein VF441_08840 [Acidimicrobiia bacterium]